ncbi:hypothetical protein FHY64_19410 [Pelagovum pacificum]|uniref:Uncharacterized protein n=2 Tax=Pelagovum pacificum TaxID=2588711 RepID=A0A5C5G7P5_9RHOB|nr:hypothetical protein I8N54_13520 [Pelagovum pacificum]TNY30783.1 hypothetical protein FHY64_19410 [Pelagovum pacificum]
MEPGVAWRRHAWKKARADLLPTLPIEVLRLRVARAKALGLPYRTYASVRASTGRDVIGFLFSTNALGLLKQDREMPADRATRLDQLSKVDRTALVQAGLDADLVAALPGLDAAHPAPLFTESWSGTRAILLDALRARAVPADGVLIVGETAIERSWAETARTAGFLTGESYFG